MGAPFRDITLYTPTPYSTGTAEYIEETSLINFVSDLYLQNMNGYKPPKTTRITIQPGYHQIWDRTWKTDSIVSIAPFFSHEEFSSLDKHGKYKYILDIIQTSTIQLSEEYGWDKTVFENAYKKTLESDFKFRIEYPTKQSKDKKKKGVLVITKNETVTSVYVEIYVDGSIITQKLFDKKNWWWYDCVYKLARYSRWFDTDRFGISYGKGKIDIWYSISGNKVESCEYGELVSNINFSRFFWLS